MSVRKTGYKESMTFYQRRFSLAESTVFRWMQQGAPLDDDRALEQWVAGKKKKPAGFRIPKTEAFKQAQEKREEETKQREPLSEDVGLRAEIRRLEQECADLHKSYRMALDVDLHAEASIKQKLWLSAQINLVRLRKETPRSEIEDGESVSIIDVETIWRRALKEFKSRLEMVPRRVVLSMKGLTPGEVEQKWQDEIADILKELQRSLESYANDSSTPHEPDREGDAEAEDEVAGGPVE